MSHSLPLGWARARLGEVVIPRNEKIDPQTMPEQSFVGLEHIEPHRRRLIGLGRAGDMKSAAAVFKEGDILYGRLRPYLNKVFVAEFDGCASGELIVMSPREGIDPHFLAARISAHDFLSFTEALDAGDRPRVRWDQIAEFELALPPTLEQARIIETLVELEAVIDDGQDHLHRSSELSAGMQAGLLARLMRGEASLGRPSDGETGEALLTRVLAERRDAFERGAGSGSRRTKWKEPLAPTTVGRIPLPEGWTWATVDQLAETQYGSSAKTLDSGEVPILRMGNIVDWAIEPWPLKYLPSDHDEFPALMLERGDVLFNRTNSAELVGKAGVYAGSPGAASFASYLIRVRLHREIRPEWLVFWLRSAYGRAWAAAERTEQVGQANINGSKLRALTIPLPPKAEMGRLCDLAVAQLEAQSSLTQGIHETHRQAEVLRRSLLTSAISGALLEQDPKDEPAEHLLARLRAAAPRPRKRNRRVPVRSAV